MIFNNNYTNECLLIHTGVPYISMGFAAIYKHLLSRSVPTSLMKISVNSKDTIFNEITKYNNIKLIGLSIHWLPQLAITLKLAEIIKTLTVCKNTKIVVGGITAGYYAKYLLKHPFIDYVIKGDGEEPICQLFDHVSHKQEISLSDIPNLQYRDHDDTIITNKNMFFTNEELLGKLEKEVIKDRTLFDHIRSALAIGRGCDENCVYCGGRKKTFQEWSCREETFIRNKDAIKESIDTILDNGGDEIYLLNDHDGKSEVISQCLEDYDLDKFKEVKIDCWGLPDIKNIQTLYKNTTTNDYRLWVEISPESGNEKTRKTTKAFSFSNEELENFIDEFFEQFPEQKIMVFFSYYLPFSDKNDTETRKYIIYLTKKYRSLITSKNLIINHWPLSTDPGSALQKNEVSSIISTINTFDDYMKQLVVTKTTIGNLLGHFPRDLSVDDLAFYCHFFRFENIIRLLNPYLFSNFITLFDDFNTYNQFLLDSFQEMYDCYINPSLKSMAFSQIFTELKGSIFGFNFERDEVKVKTNLDIIWLRILLTKLQTWKKLNNTSDWEEQKECFHIDNSKEIVTQRQLFDLINESITKTITESVFSRFIETNERPHYTYALHYNDNKVNMIHENNAMYLNLRPIINPYCEFQQLNHSMYQNQPVSDRQNLLMLGDKNLLKLLQLIPGDTFNAISEEHRNNLSPGNSVITKEIFLNNYDTYRQIIIDGTLDTFIKSLAYLIAESKIMENNYFSGSDLKNGLLIDGQFSHANALYAHCKNSLDLYYINFCLNYTGNNTKPLFHKSREGLIVYNSFYFPPDNGKTIQISGMVTHTEYTFLSKCDGTKSIKELIKEFENHENEHYWRNLTAFCYIKHLIY